MEVKPERWRRVVLAGMVLGGKVKKNGGSGISGGGLGFSWAKEKMGVGSIVWNWIWYFGFNNKVGPFGFYGL